MNRLGAEHACVLVCEHVGLGGGGIKEICAPSYEREREGEGKKGKDYNYVAGEGT